MSAAELEARVAPLWDFADPAGTAAAFEAAADASDDAAESAVLRTQQARAVGLAGDFAAAGAILDEALAVFERAVTARIDAGQLDRVLVARWCVGRTLRTLGRYDEALALMRELTSEPAGADDDYVHEEVAANLTALGRDA